MKKNCIGGRSAVVWALWLSLSSWSWTTHAEIDIIADFELKPSMMNYDEGFIHGPGTVDLSGILFTTDDNGNNDNNNDGGGDSGNGGGRRLQRRPRPQQQQQQRRSLVEKLVTRLLLDFNPDIDGDGTLNGMDPDVDQDGLANGVDTDVDGDNLQNGNDLDVDGDGLNNGNDLNVDGDEFDNGNDPDVDGDGQQNGNDPDVDGDGLQNGDDPDVDGDGQQNGNDSNVDGDGLDNGSDPDVDGDGQQNGSDPDVDGDGQQNGSDSDVDGDGQQNGNDSDVDGDGLNNAVDPDVDGDGLNNAVDPDVDGDGLNNGADPDIDGDGLKNTVDSDMDGDGTSNTQDNNMDGDGLNNDVDPDVDGDGIPNTQDQDMDGDGTPNTQDQDMDGDGTPNNVDLDMDGDGLNNNVDNNMDGDGFDNNVDQDMDGDGLDNNVDQDIDGDGLENNVDQDMDGDGAANDVDSSMEGYQPPVIDVVVFHLDGECGNPFVGCTWGDELGVGGGRDAFGANVWCCNEEALSLSMCDQSQAGRLIINQDKFKGSHYTISIPSDQPLYANLPGQILPLQRSGAYVAAYANCNMQNGGVNVNVSGRIAWRSSDGYLPGFMYAMRRLAITMSVFFAALFLWYGGLMIRFRQSRIPLEKWFFAVIALAMLEMVLRCADYAAWNSDGIRNDGLHVLSLMVGNFKHGCSRCLVLMLSLGWGVAVESLRKCVMIFILVLGASFIAINLVFQVVAAYAFDTRHPLSADRMDQVFQLLNSLLVALLVVNVLFFVSIPTALYMTMQNLRSQKQFRKLERYNELLKIFLASFVFSLVTWSFFGYEKNNNAGVLGDGLYRFLIITGEINYFFVLTAMAILWRPNPTAREYAFCQELPTSEEDEVRQGGTRDTAASREGFDDDDEDKLPIEDTEML